MKHLIFAFVLLFTLSFSAEANHRRPFTYHGHHNGVPFGYGYWFFPQVGGVVPNASGFSFWPYRFYHPRYATFAAISYSVERDSVGYVWGQPTLVGALNSAQWRCNHSDCKPVVWVQGGCAALAIGKTQQRLGWAYSFSNYNAQAEALRGCRAGSVGPTDCVVRAWVCSF